MAGVGTNHFPSKQLINLNAFCSWRTFNEHLNRRCRPLLSLNLKKCFYYWMSPIKVSSFLNVTPWIKDHWQTSRAHKVRCQIVPFKKHHLISPPENNNKFSVLCKEICKLSFLPFNMYFLKYLTNADGDIEHVDE